MAVTLKVTTQQRKPNEPLKKPTQIQIAIYNLNKV